MNYIFICGNTSICIDICMNILRHNNQIQVNHKNKSSGNIWFSNFYVPYKLLFPAKLYCFNNGQILVLNYLKLVLS